MICFKESDINETEKKYIPEVLVRVPKPSMALENGLLFRLERVGVIGPKAESLALAMLVVLPDMFQLLSGFNTADGVDAITARRYSSASELCGTSWAGRLLLA